MSNTTTPIVTAQQGQDQSKEDTTMLVRYYTISLFNNTLILSWLSESREFKTKKLTDIRHGLYSVIALMEKGIQPHFISFHPGFSPERRELVKMVQAVNKEDEANFFVEFVNPKFTHFRVWKLLAAKTEEHLNALADVAEEIPDQQIIIPDNDPFKATKCGHCGDPEADGLCSACEGGFEATRGDFGELSKGEKAKLTRALNQRRKKFGYQESK